MIPDIIKTKDEYITESVKRINFLSIKATNQSCSFDHKIFKCKFV